jgi:hypothetical protein
MHKSILSSFVENFLHVSTSLDHLQGEQFRYTGAALIQLSENVPLTSHSLERERSGPRRVHGPSERSANSVAHSHSTA